MRSLKRLVFAALFFYVLLCAALFLFQRQFIFHPATRAIDLDVAQVPGATTVEFTAADGTRLLGWWVPPRDASYPVYLYLPGNAGTLASRARRFALLTEQGAGLLAVSWRGYGGSSGVPSEQGLKADSLGAYDFVRAMRIRAEQLILFGESLGTGMAVQLAAEREAAALVLDAAYPSLLQVAQYRLRWLPVKTLMQETYEVEALAPHISLPLLQRHCSEDSVLPEALARRLFEAFASSDKRWFSVDGDCHLPAITPWLGELRRLEQLLRRVVA